MSDRKAGKDAISSSRRGVIGLAFAFFWCANVFAAPSISGVSGPIADGSDVKVTGSGFGLGDGTPLLWDDFESGRLGGAISPSPLIGSWLPDDTPPSIYSGTEAYSGAQSLYAAYDSTNQWSTFIVRPIPPADRLFQSFRFWWSSEGTEGQLKLAQVHGDCGCGNFAPSVNVGSSTTGWWFTSIWSESGRKAIGNMPKPARGAWHTIEIELQRSSSGGVADGSVLTWIDGILAVEKRGIVTRDSSAFNWNETSFFHGVTNMGTKTDVYIDDVYLNDSWARVLLSDSPTYSGATIREIQPATQWDDGSITVTLNKGRFANLEGLYLYVVDADGRANEAGWKLDGVAAPKPPTDVSTTTN